jgi:hypothetical protein
MIDWLLHFLNSNFVSAFAGAIAGAGAATMFAAASAHFPDKNQNRLLSRCFVQIGQNISGKRSIRKTPKITRSNGYQAPN